MVIHFFHKLHIKLNIPKKIDLIMQGGRLSTSISIIKIVVTHIKCSEDWRNYLETSGQKAFQISQILTKDYFAWSSQILALILIKYSLPVVCLPALLKAIFLSTSSDNLWYRYFLPIQTYGHFSILKSSY